MIAHGYAQLCVRCSGIIEQYSGQYHVLDDGSWIHLCCILNDSNVMVTNQYVPVVPSKRTPLVVSGRRKYCVGCKQTIFLGEPYQIMKKGVVFVHTYCKKAPPKEMMMCHKNNREEQLSSCSPVSPDNYSSGRGSSVSLDSDEFEIKEEMARVQEEVIKLEAETKLVLDAAAKERSEENYRAQNLSHLEDQIKQITTELLQMEVSKSEQSVLDIPSRLLDIVEENRLLAEEIASFERREQILLDFENRQAPKDEVKVVFEIAPLPEDVDSSKESDSNEICELLKNLEPYKEAGEQVFPKLLSQPNEEEQKEEVANVNEVPETPEFAYESEIKPGFLRSWFDVFSSGFGFWSSK